MIVMITYFILQRTEVWLQQSFVITPHTFGIMIPNNFKMMGWGLVFQKCTWGEAGMLFEIGIEHRFGVKATFECQSHNRQVGTVGVFGKLLEFFDTVVIDEVVEVFTLTFIDHQ